MEIIISKRAKKFIETQDNTNQKRLLIGINRIPMGDIKKLKGQEELYSLRIGDIRIIFFIDNNIIHIQHIAYRGDVYK